MFRNPENDSSKQEKMEEWSRSDRVEKERARWFKRKAVKSRKRAAEEVTYERKRRDEDARKRQTKTEANGNRKRTIDQHFR